MNLKIKKYINSAVSIIFQLLGMFIALPVFAQAGDLGISVN